MEVRLWYIFEALAAGGGGGVAKPKIKAISTRVKSNSRVGRWKLEVLPPACSFFKFFLHFSSSELLGERCLFTLWIYFCMTGFEGFRQSQARKVRTSEKVNSESANFLCLMVKEQPRRFTFWLYCIHSRQKNRSRLRPVAILLKRFDTQFEIHNQKLKRKDYSD